MSGEKVLHKYTHGDVIFFSAIFSVYNAHLHAYLYIITLLCFIFLLLHFETLATLCFC